MIFQPARETLPREDLEQLQIERLQSTLNRIYRNVAFYKQLFDKHHVEIEKIKTVADLKLLPFTTREDLNRSYPYDMFAVPLRDIVRIQSTSGTTGKPVVVGYTRNDLHHWTECTARLMTACGITVHDVVQVAFPYDLFTGGLGFHQGAELIGASVIPASTSPVEKQLLIMKDFKTTVLACTPSFGLAIAGSLHDLKIHPEELYLRTGIFGSEPWSRNLLKQLETSLHINAYDHYGLTEIIGPGVAGECAAKAGLHVNEDHFILEIVNPADGLAVKQGESGELVFTTITKEGFPLVRYRTGDMAAVVSTEPCICGRTFTRITPITGRSDDLIFFSGRKIFPSQVENILLGVEGTGPHFQIILDRTQNSDRMELKVEISSRISIDELKNLEQLRETIIERIHSNLEIQVYVSLVEPGSIERTAGGKQQRVIDRRKS